MATQPDHSGLEVDPDATAPELVPQYDPYDHTKGYGAAAQDHPYPYPGQLQQKPKGPFGTTFLTFGILVTAITAIIVGGALGGGLGAALANCQNSDSSVETLTQTSTCPTPTAEADAAATETNNNGTYLPKLYTDVKNLTIDCETKGFKKYFTTPGGSRFKWYCGVDARKSATNSIRDIGVVIAYTIEDCASACAQMRNAPTSAGEDPVGYPCKAVVFDRGMANAVEKYNGNCWLKSDKKADENDVRWVYNQPHLSYAEMTT
ncbi:hypothetical protein Neosp_001320 [[Neocosmospora] mangrovei]